MVLIAQSCRASYSYYSSNVSKSLPVKRVHKKRVHKIKVDATTKTIAKRKMTTSSLQSLGVPSLHFNTLESLNEINQFINEVILQSGCSMANVGSNNKTKRCPSSTQAPNSKHRMATPSAKRITKSRRQIPDNKEYIPEMKPTAVDVIAGRGGRTNHHTGNREYWLQVLSERPAYQACKPNDEKKTEIAMKILNFVHENGGRFLELHTPANRWFVLPRKAALMKVKQALRDRHVPKWARPGVIELSTAEQLQNEKLDNDAELGGFLKSIVFSVAVPEQLVRPLGYDGSLGSMKNKFQVKSIDMAYDLLKEVVSGSGAAPTEGGVLAKGSAGFWDAMFSEALAPLARSEPVFNFNCLL
jgi:hypothetical protein